MIKCFDDNDLVNPRRKAHNFLNLISILMGKLKEHNQSHIYLNPKIKKLILILELYSQSSSILIALYYKLFNFNHQKISHGSMLSKLGSFDLKHLIKLSKHLKKPFSGRCFVNKLAKHPPDFGKKNFDKDAAVQYAQSILEANYMTLVEIKSKINL